MSSQSFLNQCKKSSQSAYEAFKELLGKLENKQTRNEALNIVHSLFEQLENKIDNQNLTEEIIKNYHFSISILKLNERKIKLLRLPSTFAPEEWSFTFFEGLSRYKKSEFEDRNVVELGCGIGWISLALAILNKPKKIYGLDINPRAVICAKINLYLNSYDKLGNPIWNNNGATLDEVVEFHVSDLFSYCRSQNLAIDRVIGCIPQVLNPDPEFTSQMLKGDLNENMSDEFLHSLSNYAPQQGQIEDQFGLGLIAKAVEESVYVLKSTGKIILNLGGRPGKKVLEQLFLRRGFSIKRIWQKKVEQAKDTDIRALVEIEKRSSHRFEFYTGQGGDTTISATTALAYAMNGGSIAHGLMVYEAKLRDPAHLPKIIKTLSQKGYEVARDAMDLSYPEDSLVEEKASFLCALANELENTEFFSYQNTSGFSNFKKNLVLFFKKYFNIELSEKNFVITPSQLISCRNLFSIYKPKRVLIDKSFASSYLSDCDEIIEVPQDSELLCELMLKLNPDMVIYSMPEIESRLTDSFMRIIEVSSKIKARVIIDISEFFDLSSSPLKNGIFRYLETNKLPSHISLMCGLVKNKIYSDLQVCFILSSNQKFLEYLVNAAELTYSRTPFLSQFYYNCVLNDLLSFQILDETNKTKGILHIINPDEDLPYIQIAQSTRVAFSNPAIAGEQLAQSSSSLIRLDYGENCLPVPAEIKYLLYEAFSHQSIPLDDADPTKEIKTLISQRWCLNNVDKTHCVLSGGVAPIFSEIARYCSNSGEKLIFPRGAYGYFVASAEFHGAAIEMVNTEEARGFKIDLHHLKEVLSQSKSPSWVILSAPIINPTGNIYTEYEIKEISEIVKNNRGILVLDSIFSGLGFNETEETMKSDSLIGNHWMILGGLSKEFASGGLRVGYALSPNLQLINVLKPCELTAPHITLKFVLKKLYQNKNNMSGILNSQREILKKRTLILTEVLNESGWKVLNSMGGLFLIATPVNLIGRAHGDKTLTFQNINQIFREDYGLSINSPEWIGIPGYYRFVLSVSDSDFKKAIEIIKKIFKSLNKK